MKKYNRVLVTGGAGFIGSHLVDRLIDLGYNVRVLDNLYPQIHPTGKLPEYFNKKAEFIKGDVTNKSDWKKALSGIDAVYHFASAVGVGQSMYEIEHYVKVNSLGTSLFLDILANEKHTVKKMIVAASMSSYGEGTYWCKKYGYFQPPLRDENQLKKGDYSVYYPGTKEKGEPRPTKEDVKQNSNSIYAIGKKNQEEMVLTVGKAYGIPSVALRFFNVYGTRQSLSNPYNGVVAIFMSRIKNNKAPVINEDGLQTRDFVHVSDVVSACISSLERDESNYHVFNIGSGRPIPIRDVAEILIDFQKSKLKVEISGKVRKLDVRHCYADITLAKKLLNWNPKVQFEDGLIEVLEWSKRETAVDKLDFALKQLEKRGLR
jgi:dTDP-L-rhamnose 4-epimerase